ncbi:MAG: MobF family relaxase [Waterburya sp.]
MVLSIGRTYTSIRQYAEERYHSQTQPIENSFWYGSGAERLGLTGQVVPIDYNNLTLGLDPAGNPLRQQQKSQRHSNPGRDLTFSAPKSVSLLCLPDKNLEIIKIHQDSLSTALDYAQQNCIYTRTGKGGSSLQQTDNATIAVFTHEENRNLDPQMHIHCVLFNFTQGEDGKWRAMHNRELYRQSMTIGMVYHHELGRGLQQLGYELDWRSDGTFDVKGYSRQQLESFSTRRTEIIDAVGIDASAATKAQACLATRLDKVYLNRQQQNLVKLDWHNKIESLGILHPQPHSQSTSSTRQFLDNLANNFSERFGQNRPELIVQKAITFLTETISSNNHFDFSLHQLLRETLIKSQGRYKLDELQQILKNHPDLIQTENKRLTTVDLIHQQKNQNLKLQMRSNNNVPKISSQDAIVQDFVNLESQKRGQTLVLTDTLEVQKQLTKTIRSELLAQNQLSEKQYTIKTLQKKNLTAVQGDHQIQNYSVGDVIKFINPSSRFDNKLYYRVEGIDYKNDILRLKNKHNQVQDLPINRYQNRQVFTVLPLELRTGEIMQFTRTHYLDQIRQNQGQRFTVLDFTENGQITIKTKGKTQTVSSDTLLHSDYSYVDTVSNSQRRKGVNHCFYAPSKNTSTEKVRENLTLIANSFSKDNLTVYLDENAQSQSISSTTSKHRQIPTTERAPMQGVTEATLRDAMPIASYATQTTRKQEWQVLVAATCLVEQLGKPNLEKSAKIFTQSGLEITRTDISLTLTKDGSKLLFDSGNATVKNTFSSNQLNQLIQSLTAQTRTLQLQQRQRDRSLSIGLDL